MFDVYFKEIQLISLKFCSFWYNSDMQIFFRDSLVKFSAPLPKFKFQKKNYREQENGLANM